MRFAVISIVALTILKLNSPVPILDTARVAHSDQVVSNFDFGVKQPQFPDRSKEIADAHQHDLNKEIAKEAGGKRLKIVTVLIRLQPSLLYLSYNG